MDKKSKRLRIEDDDICMLQVPIDKETYISFKIQCLKDGITIKDKITKMIKRSLTHL